MCQEYNNTKSKKGKHLEYSERQSIERWYNRKRIHSAIGYKISYQLDEKVA